MPRAVPDQFSYQFKPDIVATRVVLSGEIDLFSAETLAKAFAKAVASDISELIVVDFKSVSFMAAVGFHLLQDLARRIKASGRRLVLELGDDHARIGRMLELGGLDIPIIKNELDSPA